MMVVLNISPNDFIAQKPQEKNKISVLISILIFLASNFEAFLSFYFKFKTKQGSQITILIGFSFTGVVYSNMT